MVANIVSLLSRALTTNAVKSSTSVATVASNNPFGNPFVSPQNTRNFASYAQNNPVKGGYFAGYHNGRANIVGQRLFLEV